MRSFHFILPGLLVAILFFLPSCSKDECEKNSCADGCPPGLCNDRCVDPCRYPEECNCPDGGDKDGAITKGDLTPEGDVVETQSGYTVVGELTVDAGEQEVVLADADLTVEFNPDGTLKNITGVARIPSPSDCVRFSDAVRADVGYFSGRYVNENLPLGFPLEEERGYFIFRIALTLELQICTTDDPEAVRPLSIRPPVGGHVLYVADYTDPFFFFSAGQDLVGSVCFGGSAQGQIRYVPLQPVAEVEPFGGRAVRCGSFSFFKVVEAAGLLIQNAEADARITLERPLESRIQAGFQAGINGELGLSAPVVTFVSFSIPLGEASAAVVAEAGTAGVRGKAFINGLAEPDNSWWPGLIPVKPAAQLRTTGYVQEDGRFSYLLRGAFAVELPEETKSCEGEVLATNEAFTLSGAIEADGDPWAAAATFRRAETELSATPPDGLVGGLDARIDARIDAGFDQLEEARQELADAVAGYEIELSLRGLRRDLPVIVSEAKSRLAAGVGEGKKIARDEIRKNLPSGVVVCDNGIYTAIDNYIDSRAAPFSRALNRLAAAVDETKDDEQTRRELEAALRELAALRVLSLDRTFSMKAGPSGPIRCFPTTSRSVRVRYSRQVLPSDVVDLLLEAADNVQYIAPAGDRKIRAEEILARLPDEEELNRLRADLQSGVKQIPTLGPVGFIQNHDSGAYTLFITLDGERREFSGSDPFAGEAVVDFIFGGILGS